MNRIELILLYLLDGTGEEISIEISDKNNAI